MIDIHCHLLYGVDDGAATIEESARMLQLAKQQGITAIILTPHYRHGMFAHPNETIAANFSKLQPLAAQLGVALALGTEYHVNSQIGEALQSGRCRTLAGSGYVLSEYSHDSEFAYLTQMTGELLRRGYVPVIAHVERYACLVQKPARVEELRRLGAWIQVNADAVLGLEGHASGRFCKKLLAKGCVDVIASDSHGADRRACHLMQCRDYLNRKFDVGTADRLLYRNPAMIWNNEYR